MGVKHTKGKQRGSIRAERVAQRVLATMGKGIDVNVSKIAIEEGYKPSTAGSGQIQATKTYRDTVEPFVERLKRHRMRVLKRMEETIGEATYNEATNGLDKSTKNIQLLTGGSTSNQLIVQISSEIASKYNVSNPSTSEDSN